MQAAKYVHREIDLVGKQFIELCRLARALNPEAEGIEMRPSSSAAALALQSFVETWRGDLLNWRPQLLSIQSRLGQNITEGDLCRALTGREPTTQQSRIPAQTVMVAGESDWASADKVEWLVQEPQLESA